MAEPPSNEPIPEDLFAAWLDRRNAGEGVDLENLIADHPDLEAPLRELASVQQKVDAALRRVFFREPKRDPEQQPTRLPAARAGMQIDDFHLVAKIGEGAMGEVWEAEQLSLGRRVALKLILPERASPRSFERFDSEARAGGRLNHPAVVTVFATGVADGIPWIAEELVEGAATLKDFLEHARETKGLPRDYYRRTAELVETIAGALHEAHENGVIHRDVKPANVLIKRDDTPKVGDFGLALLVDEGSIGGLGLVGTPQYMSPEQAAAKAPGIDRRTDVFSLGVVMYELLTLRVAFEAETRSELYEKILYHAPSPPRLARSEVPEELSVICMKALEKRRRDRFQTLAELADELRRFLDHRPIATKPPGPLGRARRWGQRNPARAVAFGALVIAGPALVAVSILYFGAEREKGLVGRKYERAMIRYAARTGDPSLAIAVFAEFRGKRDPEVHLLLAEVFARYGLWPEAQTQLALAEEKGFTPGEERIESARDHFFYALYLLAVERRPRFEEAERHLSAAESLDPGLPGSQFLLYQVRDALEDGAGAREALVRYLERLDRDDPLRHLARALLHEQDGEYARGLEALEELRDAEGDTYELEHLVHRTAGRLHLQLNDLESARESLERAVAILSNDSSSWLHLAIVHLRRADRDSWQRARQCVLEARRANPYRTETLRLAPVLAANELRASIEDGPPAELWTEARTFVKELREAAPEDPLLPRVEAEVAFLRGYRAYRDDRNVDAEAAFREALALDPGHAEAHVHMAELLYGSDRFAEALAHLSRARGALGSRSAPMLVYGVARIGRQWDPGLDVRIEVWTFGAAAHAGEVAVARRARRWLDARLERDADVDPLQLLNYAEFLARAPEPLRDCTRALEIVDDHELERRLDDSKEALDLLLEIERLCQ